VPPPRRTGDLLISCTSIIGRSHRVGPCLIDGPRSRRPCFRILHHSSAARLLVTYSYTHIHTHETIYGRYYILM
jgi:hypothetical protein